MRLHPKEIETIVSVGREIYGADVHVYLFGSRTDDSKRGGDIDLLIRTPYQPKKGILARIRMAARLKTILGDRKIDIIGDNEDNNVSRIAEETGILLHVE
jgi:predicted nucleotidyltransferase